MRPTHVAVIGLGSLLCPLLATPTAVAAPTPPTQATAWAAYGEPDPWVRQDANLHWYVSTPVLDAAALRKKVQITVTSPRTLDCNSLGAGFQKGADWQPAAIRTKRCTPTRAVIELTPTAAMKGARVTLTGWSAVGARKSSSISGTVKVAGHTSKAASTATRTAAPKPVGTLVKIGTAGGKPVYTASQSGVNEIWVGTGAKAVRHQATAGDAWHVGMEGTRVDVWTKDGAMLRGWHLDLATNKVTTQELPSGAVSKQGLPGFWLRHDGRTAGTVGGEEWLYDWSGTKHVETTLFFARPGRNAGFSDHHAYGITGGQIPTQVSIWSLDGTPVQVIDAPGVVMTVKPDHTGAVVTWGWANDPDSGTCRITPGKPGCVAL